MCKAEAELGSFEPNTFTAGTIRRSYLHAGDAVSLPLIVVSGVLAGKTLVVTAGVHGDEYEGVRSLLEICGELDPQKMTGRLIAVPVVNLPAFWRGTRTNPMDGQNLARIMPGKVDGTASEKIAYALAHSVLDHADFYLDLHSGGIAYSMPSMVGFCSSDARSRAAAEAFGASSLWGHSHIAPGRTISYAASRSIPWLYTEARGAGRIHPDDLSMMKTGIYNLLQHLGILPGCPPKTAIQYRLRGDGNIDNAVPSTKAGFLLQSVRLLQEVRPGDVLGTLVDPLGEVLEEYRAERNGIVAMIREFPIVRPGDPLFLLADRDLA